MLAIDVPQTFPSQTGDLLIAAKDALEARGYRYVELELWRHRLTVRIENDSARYSLSVSEHADHRALMVRGQYDQSMPAERLATVAELLCRLNAHFGMGNFDLDFSTGEVSFRRSIDVRSATVNRAALDRAVEAVSFAVELCQRSFDALLERNEEPAMAADRAFAIIPEKRA